MVPKDLKLSKEEWSELYNECHKNEIGWDIFQEFEDLKYSDVMWKLEDLEEKIN
jgi:hypothetical protein